LANYFVKCIEFLESEISVRKKTFFSRTKISDQNPYTYFLKHYQSKQVIDENFIVSNSFDFEPNEIAKKMIRNALRFRYNVEMSDNPSSLFNGQFLFGSDREGYVLGEDLCVYVGQALTLTTISHENYLYIDMTDELIADFQEFINEKYVVKYIEQILKKWFIKPRI